MTIREPIRAKIKDFINVFPWTFWGIVVIGGGLLLLTVLYFPVMLVIWLLLAGLGAFIFLIIWIVMIIREWTEL